MFGGQNGSVLAHLHHGKRVRPHHHRHWARDAVVAAQIGAAALIVVTALEHARGDRTESADAVRTEMAVATPGTAAGFGTSTDTGGPGAGALDRFAGSEAPAPVPAAEATGAPPVASTDPALPGHIELALLHGDGTSAPVGHPTGPLLGPLSVTVQGADGATVATAEVPVGQVGRIEGLAAGTYRLVLSTESPITEPSEGVAIGAASTQLTDPISIVDGDVLLVAAQANPLPAA